MQPRAHRSRTKVVLYEVHGEPTLRMAELLNKGLLSGVISNGHEGRTSLWFEGQPGAELRAFREEMLALQAAGPPQFGTKAHWADYRACVRAIRARQGAQ